MFRLVVILFILLASVWGGIELMQHPGYALIVFQQWIVKLPLWLAFLGMIILFLALYLLLRLSAFFSNLDKNFRAWLSRLHTKRAYDKTQQGLLALKEERWSSAERNLLAGINSTKKPVINYLFAAEAAEAQKAFERCDTYLQKAYKAAPEEELVIGLMQARIQLEQNLHEQALATLTRVRQLSPYHPGVLKMQERMYIQLSQWQELLSLLPYLQSAKVVSADQLLIFEKNIYCELLDEAKQKNLSIHAVRELWQTISKRIRLFPEVLVRYARLLKEDKNSADEIEPLICKVLSQEWHADLVKIYSALQTSDPAKQLAVAETWIKQFGKRHALLLTLGRLSMRCQLWGKARSYLEENLKQELNSEAQYELARLLEQLGETQLALQHYKSGLAQAIVEA